MSPTILDAEDSFLYAQAEVEEWEEEFMQEWIQPVTDLALVMLANRLPPEVHEALKDMDPEAHKAFMDRINRIQGR